MCRGVEVYKSLYSHMCREHAKLSFNSMQIKGEIISRRTLKEVEEGRLTAWDRSWASWLARTLTMQTDSRDYVVLDNNIGTVRKLSGLFLVEGKHINIHETTALSRTLKVLVSAILVATSSVVQPSKAPNVR